MKTQAQLLVILAAVLGLALASSDCARCNGTTTTCSDADGECRCKPGYQKVTIDDLKANPHSFVAFRIRSPSETAQSGIAPESGGKTTRIEVEADDAWIFPAPEDSSCWDIDECAQGMCGEGCINGPGSFQCDCPPGTITRDDETVLGSKPVCTDLDECQLPGGTGHDCHASANCINIDVLSGPPEQPSTVEHPLTGEAIGYRCECDETKEMHPILLGHTAGGCMPIGAIPGPVVTQHRGEVHPKPQNAFELEDLPEGAMTAEMIDAHYEGLGNGMEDLGTIDPINGKAKEQRIVDPIIAPDDAEGGVKDEL